MCLCTLQVQAQEGRGQGEGGAEGAQQDPSRHDCIQDPGLHLPWVKIWPEIQACGWEYRIYSKLNSACADQSLMETPRLLRLTFTWGRWVKWTRPRAFSLWTSTSGKPFFCMYSVYYICFRQYWTDRRLLFNSTNVDELVLNWQFLNWIWRPDTYFVNGQESYLHKVAVPNRFIRQADKMFIL